jgi:predicted aspartyl protease
MIISAEEKLPLGRVVTEATIENLADLLEVRSGKLNDQQVRRLVVHDALVDTGCFSLSLPASMIAQLGLYKVSRRRLQTAAGPRDADQYSAVRLTIQGRSMTVDVSEVPDGCPVLIGQIPLEYMDFVVDPGNQRLIGNPAHGGEWVNELF